MYKILSEHIKRCLKTVNYPPRYSPKKWAKKEFNCYMYALDICMDFSRYRHKCRIAPGFLSRGKENDYTDNKEDTLQYFMEDCKVLNLNISETTMNEKIKKNEYKVAVYVEENWDYHFIRQDSNGNWSEKDGWEGDIRIVNKKKICKKKYDDRYSFIGMFKISKK